MWSIHKIIIQKVRVHTGKLGNDVVDQLANEGTTLAKPALIPHIHIAHTISYFVNGMDNGLTVITATPTMIDSPLMLLTKNPTNTISLFKHLETRIDNTSPYNNHSWGKRCQPQILNTSTKNTQNISQAR